MLQLLYNVVGKAYGGAARSVELVDVVRFAYAYVIFGVAVHDFGQLPVDVKHDVYTNAEVGGYKQALLALQAVVYHIFQLVVPTGGAYNNRYVDVETLKNIKPVVYNWN